MRSDCEWRKPAVDNDQLVCRLSYHLALSILWKIGIAIAIAITAVVVVVVVGSCQLSNSKGNGSTTGQYGTRHSGGDKCCCFCCCIARDLELETVIRVGIHCSRTTRLAVERRFKLWLSISTAEAKGLD